MYGTAEQRARFYPKLATGEMIAAFCLTEPGAGSDAASIKTTAVRDGDDWVLDGSKLWITNGGLASFFTVFAKTGKPDERGKLTAFIVTRDMKGVSVGPHEDKMGLRASSTTAVFLDGVRVPAANVLGEVGKGFKVAMKILNSGRSGLGGGCIGGMKRMIELATRQAKGRVQFGKPIAEFGLIKQKVGHMVVETYAAESTVAMVAGLVDQGYEDYAVEAAISKVFATEALWRTTDEALQISAGNGYMREYPYERALPGLPHLPDLGGDQRNPPAVHRPERDERRGRPPCRSGGEPQGRAQRPDQGLRRAERVRRSTGRRWPPTSGGSAEPSPVSARC
jgi:alkylation response protein AidB-like acyl-CoA dehydrogenase